MGSTGVLIVRQDLMLYGGVSLRSLIREVMGQKNLGTIRREDGWSQGQPSYLMIHGMAGARPRSQPRRQERVGEEITQGKQ